MDRINLSEEQDSQENIDKAVEEIADSLRKTVGGLVPMVQHKYHLSPSSAMGAFSSAMILVISTMASSVIANGLRIAASDSDNLFKDCLEFRIDMVLALKRFFAKYGF